MSDTPRDRALILLADRDAVCAHLDTAGPHADPQAYEHREEVDRQLADLVPDLLAELDTATTPAVRIRADEIAADTWIELHHGPSRVEAVKAADGRIVVDFQRIDGGRGIVSFLPDVEVARIPAPVSTLTG